MHKCKATTVKGERCKNDALRYTDFCWMKGHKAQRGEVYHAFQFEGIDTASTHESPEPLVKLPEAIKALGLAWINKIRNKEDKSS